MKKKDVREIFSTAISLFLICAVAAGVLAYVNSITAPATEAIRAANENAARAEVLPEATAFGEEIALDGDGAACEGKTAAGEACGWVFTTSASSYGGRLTVMTGVGADGAVTGIKILNIEDTPGLGMNAKRPEFLNRFLGKSGTLTVVKGEAGDQEIQAITSATITSRAVTAAVNEALAAYRTLNGEAE